MMKLYRNNIWGIGALFLVMVLFLSACGTTEEVDDSIGEATPSTIPIAHAMGTTDVPEHPTRIVTLTNEATEAVLSMGITPVGATQGFSGDPWYNHLSDALKDTENVGTESEVNLETIAALKPDLIIGTKMRQEKVYDQLSAIAPTVMSETLRGDWKENFALYAQAINKVDEGNTVLNDYNTRVADISEKLGDQKNQEISMVRFMPGDVRIYHQDTFSGVILNELGFKRPGDQNNDDFAERNVSKERIPAMDGDIIFYFTYSPVGDDSATELENEYLNDPLFQNLEAAKNGQVYKVDDVIWNTAGGVIAANLMLDDIEQRFSLN